MAETISRTELAIDLEEMSARADILRGATDRKVVSVLGARAARLGVKDKRFRPVLRDNITHWQEILKNSRGVKYGWDVALGSQGRNASLEHRHGQLYPSTRNWAELQLTGYLTRLEAVEIELINDDNNIVQIAFGTLEDIPTSLQLRQTEDTLQAYGSGPAYKPI